MSTLTYPRLRRQIAPWTLSDIGLRVGGILAAILFLWAAWLFTARTVTVTVDGQIAQVRTHRGQVEKLLLDLGLTLAEADLVSVPLNEPIRHQMQVDVSRAPSYRLLVDNRNIEVASWGKTPIEVVRDANVVIEHHDRVIINGNLVMPDRPHLPPTTTQRAPTVAFGYPWQAMRKETLQMRVYRAVPISISDGGLSFDVPTTAQTVGEALRDLNIVIYRGDTVVPSMSSPINTGLRVYIERSTFLSVLQAGQTVKSRSQARTVGDALSEMDIVLAGMDEIEPSLETELYDGIEIRVTRFSEDIEVEEDIAPFETVFVPDRNLLIDTQQVVNPGAEGITRRRTRVRYRDGEEIERELEDQWVAQEPAQRVIAYGQNIVPNTAIVDGQEITYWRKIRMLATSYSAATAGVSPDVPWYGVTYSGEPMRKGIVAIDPIVVPLRSRVYVPSYGFGDALDTGSAILARRIDLGYDDSNLVLWNSWQDVYLLWPPPPEYQITWVLPNFPIER